MGAGRKPDRHLIDGREMKVKEIAGMLGITERTLAVQRSNLGGCSYQLVVDMYRQNRLLTKHDKAPRHLVDGEWITVRDAAGRVGVHPQTLLRWRKERPGTTLADAVEHYRLIQSGALERYHGRKPKAFYVAGSQLTYAQAAEKYRASERALRMYVSRHGCTLNTAVKRLEQRRRRKAEKEIMSILGY